MDKELYDKISKVLKENQDLDFKDPEEFIRAIIWSYLIKENNGTICPDHWK